MFGEPLHDVLLAERITVPIIGKADDVLTLNHFSVVHVQDRVTFESRTQTYDSSADVSDLIKRRHFAERGAKMVRRG